MKVIVSKEMADGEKRGAAVPAAVERMVATGMAGGDVLLKVQRPSAREVEQIPEGAAAAYAKSEAWPPPTPAPHLTSPCGDGDVSLLR
jgi:NAD/NADP transhydrogenase alpha subunit